ncbi:MAG TPA: sugar phosphate isomerase/epimerase [Puia sp.]|jgi:sugar phosphate isomerase/epimerase
MTSRRKFVQAAGLSVFGAGLTGWRQPAASPGETGMPKGAPLMVGIAGYTFTKIPVDTGISMMKRVGITELSIKDKYCPLDSPPETIHAVVEKFRGNGIHIYAAGVIYMKTEQEVDRAFEYGKNMGVDLIVCAPNPELLSYTEQKVKGYNIRAAIHNHGPEDKLYPSPADVYNRIKNMDARVGLCLDIGHAVRAGADPVKVVGDYAPRIFDLHIKDLAVVSKVAKPIELGRGVLDIPGLVKALNRIGYTGRCSIEHEMDMNDPLPGIAESAGYFRGVVKTLG